MWDVHGFETVDDDDLDGDLIESETGLEAGWDDGSPDAVVFEIGLSDAGSATEFAREAATLGYDVEMREPDDGEAFYEVICTRTMPGGAAGVAHARRELEALAEELGCMALDADEEPDDRL